MIAIYTVAQRHTVMWNARNKERDQQVIVAGCCRLCFVALVLIEYRGKRGAAHDHHASANITRCNEAAPFRFVDLYQLHERHMFRSHYIAKRRVIMQYFVLALFHGAVLRHYRQFSMVLLTT